MTALPTTMPDGQVSRVVYWVPFPGYWAVPMLAGETEQQLRDYLEQWAQRETERHDLIRCRGTRSPAARKKARHLRDARAIRLLLATPERMAEAIARREARF